MISGENLLLGVRTPNVKKIALGSVNSFETLNYGELNRYFIITIGNWSLLSRKQKIYKGLFYSGAASLWPLISCIWDLVKRIDLYGIL